MEIVTMYRNSPKYGFKKGDSFTVKRTIMGECVVIRNPNAINLIWSEGKLRSYGNLSGEPVLG